MHLTLVDYAVRPIRLTDERLADVRDHPEMRGLESAIGDVLQEPACAVQSLSDPAVRLYHRRYVGTRVGDKYVCVVVKTAADEFVLTAYVTDTVKKGRLLWPAPK